MPRGDGSLLEGHAGRSTRKARFFSPSGEGLRERGGVPAVTSSDGALIGCPLVIRVLGWWMCALAVFGLGAIALQAGAVAFIFVGLLWTTPAFWWGWRISHIGVSVENDALVIRNALRTHRVPWADISDVGMYSRRDESRGRGGPPVPRVFDRRVGVVWLDGLSKPIEMQATDWLWSTRSILGPSKGRADDAVGLVRTTWLERRPPSPSSRTA